MPSSAGPARQRDIALIGEAHRHDAAGFDALRLALPAEVADLEKDLGGPGATQGPIRLAMRDLAAHHRVGPALEAFRRADDYYWRVVMAWEPWIMHTASRAEAVFGMDPGELSGLYWYIGYNTAIRLDPEVSSFGTFFKYWRMSIAPRSPELRTLVDKRSENGGRIRMTVTSLELMVNATDSEDQHTVTVELAAEPTNDMDRLDARDFFAAVAPRLLPSDATLLAMLRENDNLSDLARSLKLTRERVRQKRLRLIGRIHEIAPGI